ncbi:hypothetical protein GS506_03365 [Rhodococcus hoagii]|nr:hypothetical protein [Prescottella equi]
MGVHIEGHGRPLATNVLSRPGDRRPEPALPGDSERPEDHSRRSAARFPRATWRNLPAGLTVGLRRPARARPRWPSTHSTSCNNTKTPHQGVARGLRVRRRRARP